ncbi:MAG: uracil-DNA glycosylase [Burkholderiaceae bacterium]|nr:MAG: uracil-DNA glycosylase [Burkholderiaceae bacterium]
MSISAEQRARLQAMGIGPVWVLRHAQAEEGGADEIAAAPAAEKTSAAAASGIDQMDWDTLEQTVSSCTACGLCKTRTQTVFGVGDQHADWLLIGEAPGAEEDARGEPFVGQAGRLLDNMLKAVGLARGQNVYIANVLKCRPPNNRNPEPSEVAQCAPYLQRQVALLQPKLIVVMGRFAAQTLLNSDASIANLRGKVHHYRAHPEDSAIPVIVTYHPAYLLRTPTDKAKSWADLCLAQSTFQQQH